MVFPYFFQFIKASCDKVISASTEQEGSTVEDRIKIMQDEIALLHNQVYNKKYPFKRLVKMMGKCDQKSTSESKKSNTFCCQVLYERHRRETLGLRNRRLLSKTKSARIFEEDNRAKVRYRNEIMIFTTTISYLCTRLLPLIF